MEWAIWIVIALLIFIIVIEGIITILYYTQFAECRDNTSPYCPQYLCPTTNTPSKYAGQSAVSYADCVADQSCPSGLTSPCSIAATSNSS